MAAVLAEHRGAEIRDRFGVELREIPVACLAHRLLATQFIKLENQAAFVLLQHQCPPRRLCCAAGLARRRCGLVSAMGANAKSRVFYNLMKGDLVIARPSLPYRRPRSARPAEPPA